MLTHTSYSSWASFWQGHDSALRNRVHACPEKDHPTYDENRMQVSSLTMPLQSRARALASKRTSF